MSTSSRALDRVEAAHAQYIEARRIADTLAASPHISAKTMCQADRVAERARLALDDAREAYRTGE